MQSADGERPANSGLCSSRSTPRATQASRQPPTGPERVRALDVLVNNAGTAEPRIGAADLTADEAVQGFGINVFGPIRVTHAFLPLLRASDNPRIVNVSSGAGSFTRILTPGTVENAVTLPVYPATKAALTMLTVQYARALDGILVNAADPGLPGPTSTTTAAPRR